MSCNHIRQGIYDDVMIEKIPQSRYFAAILVGSLPCATPGCLESVPGDDMVDAKRRTWERKPIGMSGYRWQLKSTRCDLCHQEVACK